MGARQRAAGEEAVEGVVLGVRVELVVRGDAAGADVERRGVGRVEIEQPARAKRARRGDAIGGQLTQVASAAEEHLSADEIGRRQRGRAER